MVIGGNRYLKLLRSREALHLRQSLGRTAGSRWNAACVSWVHSPPPDLRWRQQRVPQSCWGGWSTQMRRCVWNLKECFHSTKNPTILEAKGENTEKAFLIRTAEIKMWLTLSLNEDYAGTSQRDECFDSFSLVALRFELGWATVDGAQSMSGDLFLRWFT